jgi:hypothetical protein
MERFQAADGRSYFEGNKIKHLYQTAPNRIYALTRHGLAKIDTQTKDVVFIDNFDPESVIDIDSNGNIFAITGDNSLQFYNTSSDNMAVIEGFRLDKSDYCYRIVISDTGVLHIFSQKGTWRITLTQSADTPNITNVENLERKHLYVSQPHCGNPVYTITEDFKIVTFDPLSGSFTDICSFTPPVGYDYSRINGVAKAPQGYWINFWEQLFFLPEGSTNLEPTEITYHSFTIVHDRFQPILWIGTDSQGLIGWNYQEPTMKHLTYRDLPCKISMPARCIHVDSDTRVLLFGTKGDGLVRVRDFSKNSEISEKDIDILHTGNSVLSDNSVYCISEDRHGCLLIGTEGRHMHYYQNGRLGRIKGSERLSHIYSIVPQNDSTLWVVTGRNLAYRKETFFDHNGFQGLLGERAGDDDLFVNKVANSINTCVICNPNALTWSAPKYTWQEWIHQKRRHLSVSPKYNISSKLRIALEPITRGIVYFLTICCIVYAILIQQWIIAAIAFGLWFIRLITLLTIINVASYRLNIKGVGLNIVLYDIALPLINLLILITQPFLRKRQIYW